MHSIVKTKLKSMLANIANGVQAPTKSKRNPPMRANKNYARKEHPIWIPTIIPLISFSAFLSSRASMATISPVYAPNKKVYSTYVGHRDGS